MTNWIILILGITAVFLFDAKYGTDLDEVLESDE